MGENNNMLHKFLILSLLSWITQPAFAGHFDATELLPGDRIECELLLHTQAGQKYLKTKMDESPLGRPLPAYDVHQMTAKGYRKIGVDPKDMDRQGMKHLILTAEYVGKSKSKVFEIKLSAYRQGQFETVLTKQFSEPLSGWIAIHIGKKHSDFDYESLISEYAKDGIAKFWGYQTESDQDGVKTFIKFSEGSRNFEPYVEFGIDVPCSDVEEFTSDYGDVTSDVYSAGGCHHRITVFTFSLPNQF